MPEKNNLLSSESASSCLPERYRLYKIICEKTVDSTNTLAKTLPPETAPHGTIIIAEAQTAGRGLGDKSFYSPHQTGLYMSIILRTDKPPHEPQMITAAAAVSVCHAIEEQTEYSPGIKWVNDILIDGKKVCGILTEAVTSPETGEINLIIVGVGINCNTPPEGFPPELRDIAGALDVENLSKSRLAASIATGIFDAFENLDNPTFLKEYDRRLTTPRPAQEA